MFIRKLCFNNSYLYEKAIVQAECEMVLCIVWKHLTITLRVSSSEHTKHNVKTDVIYTEESNNIIILHWYIYSKIKHTYIFIKHFLCNISKIIPKRSLNAESFNNVLEYYVDALK